MATRRTLDIEFKPLRLRLVEEDFSDDETPSLPGMPVVETTGEDITHVTRAAGLRKCPAAALPERRRKGGVR
jgi:hypothetical protein